MVVEWGNSSVEGCIVVGVGSGSGVWIKRVIDDKECVKCLGLFVKKVFVFKGFKKMISMFFWFIVVKFFVKFFMSDVFL